MPVIPRSISAKKSPRERGRGTLVLPSFFTCIQYAVNTANTAAAITAIMAIITANTTSNTANTAGQRWCGPLRSRFKQQIVVALTLFYSQTSGLGQPLCRTT